MIPLLAVSRGLHLIQKFVSDADSKLILIRQSPKWPGVINHAGDQLIGQFLSRNDGACVTCHIIPSLKGDLSKLHMYPDPEI